MLKKTFFKKLMLIFTCCISFTISTAQMSALAQEGVFNINYNDINGSFSDRSLIMKNLYGKETINQEQKDLLISKKLNLSTKCLFEQIKKNNVENVKLLLDSKLDPNISYYSDYPIYYAAKLNREEIALMLLDYGAKLDRGFYSELYEAVKHKNSVLAQSFLNHGAKVNYTDSVTRNSIIYYALKNDMIDVAEILIQKGAKPDRQSVLLIKLKKITCSI